MTTFAVSEAFAEGLRRERSLFGERADWSREQWLERKVFLEELIDEEIDDAKAQGVEIDRAEKARLQGRLMAVCLEGATRFGD